MGVVYEAEDKERGQKVALKTITNPDVEKVYQLKREFRVLADLSHPNLVALYDLVVDASACFFTMELLDGQDLLSYVTRRNSDAELAFAQTRQSVPVRPGVETPVGQANVAETVRSQAAVIARGSDAALGAELAPAAA